MDLPDAVSYRVGEEGAVEYEGVILAALSTRIDSSGQGVSESSRQELPAVFRRQPLGVNADCDSSEAEGNEFVVQLRSAPAPKGIAPRTASLRSRSRNARRSSKKMSPKTMTSMPSSF